MHTIATIGLDIVKLVFHVHGVDAAGQVVIRRQLKRRYVLAFFQKLPPCLVGIEACASQDKPDNNAGRVIDRLRYHAKISPTSKRLTASR